ncbi:MarR family transcriptional regulator [Candidatus Accumulibacter sp. ACC003]|uniref:MarR family winged helix-turn-helix transcriptional regulator n=1 Tax=Candidatus Accumulibacter sp. ACC003 TaxID=2823334 RepID=UPI0025BBCFDF|nr:MarR family transcriptional regulator [Candidatus Accumulibacter sp. ACC003]
MTQTKKVGSQESSREQLPDGQQDGPAAGADDAFGKLLQLVRSVQNGMQNIDDTHGLSGSQLWALWQISARPGLRVSQLASALHIRPSTASNLLDKLEARQLVRRERRDTDNRVVRLHLTDEGAEVIKDIPGPMQGQLRGALGKMPPPVLGNLRQGMASLLELMGESSRRSPVQPKA